MGSVLELFFITLQLARENRGLTTKGTFVLEKNELNTINKNTQTRLPVQPVMEPSERPKEGNAVIRYIRRFADIRLGDGNASLAAGHRLTNHSWRE